MPLKLRTQARIPGVSRRRYSTAVLNQIEAAVERESARYGVSRSFVIANALAYAFGIPIESYLEEGPVKKGRPKRVHEVETFQ